MAKSYASIKMPDLINQHRPVISLIDALSSQAPATGSIAALRVPSKPLKSCYKLLFLAIKNDRRIITNLPITQAHRTALFMLCNVLGGSATPL